MRAKQLAFLAFLFSVIIFAWAALDFGTKVASSLNLPGRFSSGEMLSLTPTVATTSSELVSQPASSPEGRSAESKRQVTLLTDYAYKDTKGDLYIVGEVRNDETSNVEQAKIMVNLFDQQGKSVATMSNFAHLAILKPDQKSPFVVIFPRFNRAVPNYEIKLSWQVTDEKPKTEMRILDTSARMDEDGGYWLEGKVQNTGSQIAEVVALVVTIYSESGKVIGVGFGLADLSPLSPNQVSTFVLIAELPKGATVGYYVVQAEGF